MDNRKEKDLLGIAYIIMMGFNYPLLRYFSTQYQNYNNNAVRFVSGGILLTLFCLYKYREDYIEIFKSKRLIFMILLTSLHLDGYMYFMTAGLKYTSSLSASIFAILAMPLAVIIAALFYKDEKEKIKHLKFVIGSIIAMIGSLIFVVYGNSQGAPSADFIKGSIFLMISITILSFQNILLKAMSKKIHPIVISANISIITGIVFFVVAWATNNLVEFKTKPISLTILLMFSGIYGIIAGMLLAINILKKHGVVVYNIIQLVIPLSTAIVAYIFLGEGITIIQVIAAVLVILGCTIALKKNKIVKKCTNCE